MKRRALGCGLIGCVVATLVVVAAVQPHRITGTATAIPVPGPPGIGDCMLDPLPDPSLNGAIANAPMRAADPVYPQQQRVHPCTGNRYGEVLEVIDRPARLVVRGDDSDGQFLDDPNWDSCNQAMRRYLGIPAQPLLGTWQGGVTTTIALLGPTSRQQAAGQHWASCIVTPETVDQGSAGSPAAGYSGTLRNAYRTGNQRNRIGYCTVSADVSADVELAVCASPHAAELFGYGESGDRPAPRSLFQTSCRQLVADLTGIHDADTTAGLSTVVAIADSTSRPVTGPQIPAHSTVTCGVVTTSGRQLDGSLLALGAGPIPWA